MAAVLLEATTNQEAAADLAETDISAAAMPAATRVVSATAVGMVCPADSHQQAHLPTGAQLEGTLEAHLV